MPPAELAAALDALGWSARYLAGLLGCTRVLVGQWLSGRTAVPPAVAAWVRRRVRDMQADPPPTASEWRRRAA